MASKKQSQESIPESRGQKAAATRAIQKETERKKREIAGVCWIGAGILLGAYLFFSGTGVLGKAIANGIFGMIGISAYIIPFLCVGFGILSIRGSASDALSGASWYMFLAILCIITLIQVIYDAPVEDVTYMGFLKEAYKIGANAGTGGGFLGALLCYPLLMLGGKVLAYVLLITALVVVVIRVTRFSLQEASNRMESSVQQAVENVKAGRDKKQMYFGDAQTEAEEPVQKPHRARTDKKEANRIADAMDAVLDFQPVAKGAPARMKTFTAPPVVSDHWDDIEPVDDVLSGMPRIAGKKKPAAPIAPSESESALPLPDTALLFGNHAKSVQADSADNPQKTKKGAKETKKATVVGSIPDVTQAIETSISQEMPAYTPPSFNLLNAPSLTYARTSESPNEKAKLLIAALENFSVSAKVVNISVGPVLTRFELQPAPGVRVARITGLSNDIALALAAPRVRIEAPIPGKAAIGIEIPNKETATVVLRDIVESKEFAAAASPITLALGKDISGKVVTADLGKMPHMLIAGATGSGKSVCINDLIISMVYKSSPAELRLILVDPKMVELSVFDALPHLLIPVVTDPKKASGALRWAVNEMTARYKKFSEIGARELSRYNALQSDPEKRMPKIVVIIDELADLMMVAPDEVEDSICRIAQLGRASGIHLIVATQRPSADVITGLIKTNIPSRCAFAVSSAIDSRIILDTSGAEKLLGRGDMLFHPNGANKPTRIQCAFVSDEEVDRVVDYFRVQERQPVFDQQVLSDLDNAAKGGATGGVFGEGKQEDELLGEAVRIVLESGQASISMIQRRLRVGYARAARLIDIMEQHKYVSGFDGSKARKVLIKRSEFEALFGNGEDEPDGSDTSVPEDVE